MKKKPMLIIRMNVDPKYDEEFNKYYNGKMAKFMEQVPLLVSSRRSVCERKGIKEYITIYEIESEDKIEECLASIPDTKEWAEWEEKAVSNLVKGVYLDIEY